MPEWDWRQALEFSAPGLGATHLPTSAHGSRWLPLRPHSLRFWGGRGIDALKDCRKNMLFQGRLFWKTGGNGFLLGSLLIRFAALDNENDRTGNGSSRLLPCKLTGKPMKTIPLEESLYRFCGFFLSICGRGLIVRGLPSILVRWVTLGQAGPSTLRSNLCSDLELSRCHVVGSLYGNLTWLGKQT